MPDGLDFPSFPSPFAEEEEKRKRELEKEAERLKEVYMEHFAPPVWEAKPAWARGLRRLGEAFSTVGTVGRVPPAWFRKITPWQEKGFTPEQADVYIREVEGELQELARVQRVNERICPITDYITALASVGLLTGEEAQLYEFIEELNPRASSRLDLTDEERTWFLDYAKTLAEKSPEDIQDIYEKQGITAPKTLEELMALVSVTAPTIDPRYIMSSVAFSKDVEAIGQALQVAYPPQTKEDMTPYQGNITEELRAYGLEPTGDVGKDVKALGKAKADELKRTGLLVPIVLADGTIVDIYKKENNTLWYQDELVGTYDPGTGRIISTTEYKAFEKQMDAIREESDRLADKMRNRQELYNKEVKELARLKEEGASASEISISERFITKLEQDMSKLTEETEEIEGRIREQMGLSPYPEAVTQALQAMVMTHTIEPPSQLGMYGKPFDLEFVADLQLIDGNLFLESDDYLIFYKGKQVGKILSETGEFKMDDPGFFWKAWIPSVMDRTYLAQSFSVPPEAFPQPLETFQHISQWVYTPKQITENVTMLSPAEILGIIGFVGSIALAAPEGIAYTRILMQAPLTTMYRHLPGAYLRGYPKPPKDLTPTRFEIRQYKNYQKTEIYRDWFSYVKQGKIKSPRGYRIVDKRLFEAYKLHMEGQTKAAQGIIDQIRWSFPNMPGRVVKGRELVPYVPPPEAPPAVPRAAPPAAEAVIPAAERWDAMSVPERVALAKSKGLAGTAGSKAWVGLTGVQQELLSAEPAKGIELLSVEYQNYLKELEKLGKEYPYPMYTRANLEDILERRGIHRPKELTKMGREIAIEEKEWAREEVLGEVEEAAPVDRASIAIAKETKLSADEIEKIEAELDALNNSIVMLGNEFDLVVNKKDPAAIARQTAKEAAAKQRADDLLKNLADEDLIPLMGIDNQERLWFGGLLAPSHGNGASDYAAQEWIRRMGAAPVAPKVIIPPVTPFEVRPGIEKLTPEARVEVTALIARLDELEPDIEAFTSSLEMQQERYMAQRAAKVSDVELTSNKEAIANLETQLKGFYAERAKLLKKLEMVAPSVAEKMTPAPIIPETGIPYTATVYRGTKPDVTPVDEGLYGKGTYYTTNLEYAKTYGETTTQQITLQNPLVIKSQQEFDAFQNPYRDMIRAELNKGTPLKEVEELIAKQKRQDLEKQGYDGLIARNIITPGDETVVFEPEKAIFAAEIPAVKSEGLSEEAVIAGEHINKAASEQQLKNAPIAEGVVDSKALVRTDEAAKEFFEKLFYTPDKGNPLSAALAGAAKTLNIKAYADALPPDLRKNIPQDFLDASFHTPARRSLSLQQPVDAAADIDWGRRGGIWRMRVLNPSIQAQQVYLSYLEKWAKEFSGMGERLGLDKPHWWQLQAKADFHERRFNLCHQVGEEDLLVPAEDLLLQENIAPLLEGLEREQSIALIEYAKKMREFYLRALAEDNLVRVKIGLEPIEPVKNYLPDMLRASVWGRFWGIEQKPEVVADVGLSPDLMKPSRTVNIHELAKKGGLKDYEKEKNTDKLFLDYVAVIGREMFYTPVIQNNKGYVANLRERGYETLATYLEDMTLRRLVGVPDPLTRWRQENIPPFLYNPVMAARRRLNPALFGVNLPWNLAVQTSSFNFLWGIVEPKYIIRAFMNYLFNPAARQIIEENVPSFIVKQKGRGSLVLQDIGHSVSEYQTLMRSSLESVDDLVTMPTKFLERYLQGISALAGWYQGEAMGLEGEKLVAYASDIAAATQSEYDVMNLPPVYGSPEIRLMAPLQTFMFTALTRLREHIPYIQVLKAGEWSTVDAALDKRTQSLLIEKEGQTVDTNTPEGKASFTVRARHIIAFLMGMWVINMVGDKLTGREPWEESSFVPMSNLLMLAVDPRNTWNLPYPYRWANDFWRGCNAVVKYGNWQPLLNRWLIRYHAPAGFATSRTIEYMLAANRGEHQDVKGDKLFDVEGFKAEDWRAWFQGVWYTKTGKEYRERMIEGLDPTTVQLIRDLGGLEKQLGTNVEGRYYTLGNYGTEVMGMFKKLNVPEWQLIEDIVPYPELFKFRLQCEIIWEEYNKLPSNQRIEYRRTHPYLDATLYFWEKTRTLRSAEAKEELEQLFKYLTPGNPRAHWRGLPEIPDYAKLLPE